MPQYNEDVRTMWRRCTDVKQFYHVWRIHDSFTPFPPVQPQNISFTRFMKTLLSSMSVTRNCGRKLISNASTGLNVGKIVSFLETGRIQWFQTDSYLCSMLPKILNLDEIQVAQKPLKSVLKSMDPSKVTKSLRQHLPKAPWIFVWRDILFCWRSHAERCYRFIKRRSNLHKYSTN